MIISVFDRVENIVGKGENAGYQHFLLFPQCLEKASFPESSKGVFVWEWFQHIKVAICGRKIQNTKQGNCQFLVIPISVLKALKKLKNLVKNL